jgi:hypothetical protein
MATDINTQQTESLNKSIPNQLDVTYSALSPEQQIKTPKSIFESKVQAEQSKGINEDVAIGNVMMNLNKTVQPPTIVGTDKAKDAVNEMQGVVDDSKQPTTTEPTTKIEVPTAESPELQGIYNEITADYDANVSLLDQMKTTTESRANQRIDSIKAVYEKRRQQMMVFNQNRLKSLEIIGSRTGRQRYAPEIQSGILSNEEKEGMERIADINRQEYEAINGIDNALQDNDFVIAKQKLDMAKDLRKEKEVALDKLETKVKENEAKQEKIYSLALTSPIEFAKAGIKQTDDFFMAINKINPFLAETELKKQTGTDVAKESELNELNELLKGLSVKEELQARYLAKEIFGDTKGAEAENVKSIAQMLAKGYSIAEIRTMLKDSGFVLGEDEDLDEILSVTEAEKLNVKYGTTKREAIALGKTPGEVSDDGLDKTLTVAEAEKLGVPFGTTKRQAIALGISPNVVLSTEERMNQETKLAKDFLAQVKDDEQALKQLSIIETAGDLLNDSLEGGKLNPISQAILVTYQKVLDPDSVVRTSEYDRSPEGQPLIDKIEGKFKAIFEGGPGVLKENLKGFVEVSQDLAKSYKAYLLDAARFTKTRSNNYGLDVNNILSPKIIKMLDEFEAPKKLPVFNQSYNSFDSLISDN